VDAEPPRPERWGGYRLAPDAYEFWEHREDRLHERLAFRLAAGGWGSERLQP
jgi:pyridoxamine 5'-phosphate oxidase